MQQVPFHLYAMRCFLSEERKRQLLTFLCLLFAKMLRFENCVLIGKKGVQQTERGNGSTGMVYGTTRTNADEKHR